MDIRCTKCGYTVHEKQESDKKLLDDIKSWINFVLRSRMKRGESAVDLNNLPSCPPCPKCGSKHTWENV